MRFGRPEITGKNGGRRRREPHKKEREMEQQAGTIATLAIIAAVASYIITFAGHPFIGVLAALVSIPLGAFGLIRAASPRVGGGIMSILALILGVTAIGVGVLGMIGAIVF